MSTADQKIARAERILNYAFLNKALCAEALQMASPQALVIFNGSFQRVYRNNRLAILGDATLAQTICKMWYSATTIGGNPKSPAAWTTARNDMLGNAALHRRGRQLGIGTVIITEAGHLGPAGANMVATTFEALFGAIYEDSGEAAVLAAVQHVGLDKHSSLM